MFGQHVPVLKWRGAVFCLCGGAPCRQIIKVHSIRRVTVPDAAWSGCINSHTHPVTAMTVRWVQGKAGDVEILAVDDKSREEADKNTHY